MSHSIASVIVVSIFIFTACLARVLWEVYVRKFRKLREPPRKKQELPISCDEKTVVIAEDTVQTIDPWDAAFSGRPINSRGAPAAKRRSTGVENFVPPVEDLEFPLRPSSRNGERPPSRGQDSNGSRPTSPERPPSAQSAGLEVTSSVRAQMRSGRTRPHTTAPTSSTAATGAPSRPNTTPAHAWSHATKDLPKDPGFMPEEADSRPASAAAPEPPPKPHERPDTSRPDDPRPVSTRTGNSRPDTSWTLPGSEFMVFAWKTWTPGDKWTISSENVPSAIPIGSRTAWEIPKSPSEPVRLPHHSAGKGGSPQSPGKPSVRLQAESGQPRPAVARPASTPVGVAARPPSSTAVPRSAGSASTAVPGSAGTSAPGSAATGQLPHSWQRFWRTLAAGHGHGGHGGAGGVPRRSPPMHAATWPWLQPKRAKVEVETKSSDSLIATMTQQLQETRGNSLEDRKRIFRDLQRQLHPDKNVDHEEAAKLAFQELMQQRASYLAA